MKFLIAERISANKYKTPEGYLVCVDSVLARTGKQTYRKNEIFVDCNDDTEIEVDRKPEEVFSEATLASFENKPITIEHPDEDVNTGNVKTLAVGFVRDIHRGKDNGQDVMLGTLVITDEEAISAVESGELLDLSCGYDCDIEDSANPQQKNIRGNHVALCENGRAGIARIVDSIEDAERKFSVTWLSRENTKIFSTVIAKDEKDAAKVLARNVGRRLDYVLHIEEDTTKDSEETKMKDKLIDIPSDILGKIESLFKARNIKITGKGKTWTGRVHYQVEFVGKAIDLKKKLDLIEKQVESLKIPMTYSIGNNKEDTLATAGVDFDKQSVADSDVEDAKEYRIFVNGSERAKWEANSAEEAVKEFMEANPAYANHKKGKVEARDCDIEISDDEDLITKAINDEVATIELYNQILAGNLDDETRAIIEEIRDDENDHLVKLTKLKNNIPSDDDIVEDEEEKIEDAGRPYVDIKVEQDFAREIESRSKRYNLYVLSRQQSGKFREITLVGEKTNSNPLRSIESLINDFELEKSDYAIKYFKDSKEKVDDAMQTFEIRWIDTYKKSKGYSKEEYLHIDKIKANTLSEALKKLADDVALAGVGTMNAMIVSIRSDKATYMYSGKLGELVRKVKDSSKIERVIKAISSIRRTK